MTLPIGSTFLDIALEQVDKKSPVDDILMTSIAEDLYYLKAAAGSGGGVFEWKVNGPLSALSGVLPFRRIDGAFVMSAVTLANHAAFLEIPGSSGTLEIDVRKYKQPLTPITGIDYQYQNSINSITRAGSSASTQSITKATPQVNTQSIAYWKTQLNIQSIIYLGNNLWRYNLDSAPDSDWIENTDYVLFASCTSAANDGTFKIVRVNDDGVPNVVVYNPNGVAQTGVAGTADLQAFAYTLTAAASTHFVVGEKALFASHTSAVNNGSFTIYAKNSGGNNIIIKNQVGVVQAGVAGTIDAYRWSYNFSSAAGADLVAGETALFQSHTTGGNNGTLPLVAINDGGNNVVVYNESGALQGGAAGTVDSHRWIYALPTDPSTDFSVGHNFRAESTTSTANSGIFSVKQVNRSATNNLVIHNSNGVTQAGAAGTLTHTRRVVKFSSDQSSVYSTASRVGIRGCPDNTYNLNKEYSVLEVNRGGGANFNIVIEADVSFSSILPASQASPAGDVAIESRSVFSTRPTITVTKDLQIASNGVLDNTEKTVAAGVRLALDILQIPSGSPENLTVHVS